MGISTTHQFIYFVVPKSGSSTIRNAIDPVRDIKRPTPHFSEHVTIERFLKSEYADLFASHFKFSFVRNPYERLYSGFLQDRYAAYNLAHWADAKKPIFDVIGDDFNRYVREYAQKADVLSDPYWVCFCPMHAFTHLNGKLALDWIGKTESLERDLTDLCERLSIPLGAIENKNVRRSKEDEGKSYLEKYDDETIAIVNALYRADFEYFSYEMKIV